MLMSLLPEIYQGNERLEAFLWCVEQVLQNIEQEIERIPEMVSPDQCPPECVEPLLANVGWTLPVPDAVKRRLIRSAIIVYKQRGTARGLQNLIRLTMGIECEVYNVYKEPGLPEGDPAFYTFEVTPIDPPRELTAEETAMVEQLANYMKPGHTHFRVTGPYAHWEMAVSELGETTILHSADGGE